MFGSLIWGQAQGSRSIQGWSCANAMSWLQAHCFSLGTVVKIGLGWHHTRAHTWPLVALWLCASVRSSGSQFLQYYKEIQLVHPKGNQSWIFTWRTDTEAETPILCPPDAKNWLIGKDPDAGKGWRRRRRRGQQRMRWLDDITDAKDVWVGSGSWWWTGKPRVLLSMGSQTVGRDWATELNRDDASAYL